MNPDLKLLTEEERMFETLTGNSVLSTEQEIRDALEATLNTIIVERQKSKNKISFLDGALQDATAELAEGRKKLQQAEAALQEARKDTERLDWLEYPANGSTAVMLMGGYRDRKTLRAAIDAAMKEKP